MRWTRPKRPASLLGLSVAGGQLHAVHAIRAKAGPEVAKVATATLALDLLHPEPELVGQEIRNHLDAAGIRERRCVVAVPAEWVMTQQCRVPDLPAEDLAAFLQLEAEKGFPCDPTQLQIAVSHLRAGDAHFVTQLAVRQEQLAQLNTVLEHAGLRAVSFSLGLPALPGVVPATGPGRLTLGLDRAGATLVAATGGGVAAFRTFDSTIRSEAGESVVNSRSLARELRVTVEQIPSELRLGLGELHLTGDAPLVVALGDALAGWAKDAGLALHPQPEPLGGRLVTQLALRHLADGPPPLEFLPPKPNRWAQLVARYSSRRLATAGFAAAALAVLTLGAFGWQEFERWQLRSQWEGMSAQVAALEVVQGRIRDYRSWYDTSILNLTVLRRITEAFPDNGNVTAKSVEIHGTGNLSVTITGTARDNTALLRTVDDLRKVKEVQAVKIEQIRGKVPAQFTFTFRWSTTPASP